MGKSIIVSHRRGMAGTVKEWCELIVVNVRKDGITIEGHSNYAEYGKDIVCAGMTAIMRTFVKSIEDLTEDKIEYKISSGKVDIHYRNL